MNNLDIFDILLEEYKLNRTVDMVFEDENQYKLIKESEVENS